MLCSVLDSLVQERQASTEEGSAVKMRRGLKHLSCEGRLREVAEYWNRLLRDVVESPSLEIFKTLLDIILCNLFQVNQLLKKL